MRSIHWSPIFVAGCLSLAGLARGQVLAQPAPEADEAQPLVLEQSPDVVAGALPPTPAPEAPAPVLIQPGAGLLPTPAPEAPMRALGGSGFVFQQAPGARPVPVAPQPGQQWVIAGPPPAAQGQPDGAYHVKVVTTRAGRDAWIGVAVSPVSPALAHQLRLNDGTGVVVESVYPKTPAEKAGIQQYDIIERVDGKEFGGPEQFSSAVRAHSAGGKITLNIIREGEPMELTAKLSRRPTSFSEGSQNFYPPQPGQPKTPFGYQPVPELRFGAKPAPPGVMPDQPGYKALPRFPDQGYPAPPGVAPVPPQPYYRPDAPAMPGAPGTRFWVPQPKGMMPPAQEGGYPSMPGEPRGKGNSVRLDYENGRLNATVYSPDGKIIMTGPVDAIAKQPAVPGDVRKMLKKLRSDRSSADSFKPKKQKARHDDDEDEDDDAQPRKR